MKARAISPEAKRKLAEYLEQENPDFLEMIKAVADAFGMLAVVEYETRDEHE